MATKKSAASIRAASTISDTVRKLGITGEAYEHLAKKIKVDRPDKYDAQRWDQIKFDLGSARKQTPSDPAAQEFVRNQIASNAKRFKRGPMGILTQCPYHKTDSSDGFSQTLNINVIPHDDNHNRFIPTGFYRCWSCGAAGPWNTLAETLRLQPLPETDNYELGNGRKLEYEIEYAPPNPALLEEIPENWKWKHKDVTVPYRTLMRVGAKFHELMRRGEGSDFHVERRLWLPCYIDGELFGHVDAALNGEQPKYLNAPGAWALTCFLYWDAAMELSHRWSRKHNTKKFVFVCEGPASAIALIRWGIPAVACLGVENWSQAKAVQLASCYDLVFACGDGDTPGYELNDAIKSALADTLPVRRLRLEQDMDPARFGVEEKEWLLRIIEKYAAKDADTDKKSKRKKFKKNPKPVKKVKR